MKAEWVVVCDYAVSDPGGKMTLVGTFDRMNVPGVPFSIPQMGIGIKLRFEQSDQPETDHPIELRIKSPKGAMMGRVEGGIKVNKLNPGEAVEMGSAGLALMLSNPTFAEFGKYCVEVWVDKRLAATVPFFVLKVAGGAQ